MRINTNRYSIDQLPEAIAQELKAFAKVTDAAVIRSVNETAKATVKNTKSKAPGKGPYRKSWTSRVTTQSLRGNYGRTVYSTLPGLPHLLEYGHEIKGYLEGRGRTRTREFPHIPDDNTTERLFEENLRKEIEKG